MSELNSVITRLKITYLAKLLHFINLKSLCRYSSKAVSLLMRKAQEMGNRRTTHNVVHIKSSDLLSLVIRFLHITSGGSFKSPVAYFNISLQLLLSFLADIKSGAKSEVSICPVPNKS